MSSYWRRAETKLVHIYCPVSRSQQSLFGRLNPDKFSFCHTNKHKNFLQIFFFCVTWCLCQCRREKTTAVRTCLGICVSFLSLRHQKYLLIMKILKSQTVDYFSLMVEEGKHFFSLPSFLSLYQINLHFLEAFSLCLTFFKFFCRKVMLKKKNPDVWKLSAAHLLWLKTLPSPQSGLRS